MTELEIAHERLRKIGDLIGRPVRVEDHEAQLSELRGEVERLRAEAEQLKGGALADAAIAAGAEIKRLRAERDAYLAYAGLLQMHATLRGDFSHWPPEEAVMHAARQATLSPAEMSGRGWSAQDVADLMDCRDAAKGGGGR